MGVDNVFLKESAVSNFEKATLIPSSAFYDIADFIIESCNLNENIQYKILDVGSGTGRTILNILNRFSDKGIKFSAICFDISQSMSKIFKSNLNKNPQLASSVYFLLHDANNGLPDYLFPNEYDITFIVSVLQYLDDWRWFLRQVHKKIALNGFLIQAELIGWYRLLDGTFDNTYSESEISVEFWQTYFKERKKFSKWNPEIKFSYMMPVKEFCENELNMMPITERNFFWEVNFSWSDVLSWIATGPVSSLGSGLSDKEKANLRDKMYLFLLNKKVDLEKEFSVRWGFKVFIHQKRG